MLFKLRFAAASCHPEASAALLKDLGRELGLKCYFSIRAVLPSHASRGTLSLGC
jgi:hypothetical protein